MLCFGRVSEIKVRGAMRWELRCRRCANTLLQLLCSPRSCEMGVEEDQHRKYWPRRWRAEAAAHEPLLDTLYVYMP